MTYPNLTNSELWYLKAAHGWIDLGSLEDAFAELARIEAGRQINPNVLEVRWRAYQIGKKWNEAITVARVITKIAPGRFSGYWMLSFALHALKQTQEAYETLSSVSHRFEAEWMTHYNLACYLVQLGRLDEARVSLRRALHISPDRRATALQDTDLIPFWCEIRSLDESQLLVEDLSARNAIKGDWPLNARNLRN